MAESKKGGTKTKQTNPKTIKPQQNNKETPHLKILLKILSYLSWSGVIIIGLQFLIAIIFLIFFHEDTTFPIIYLFYSLTYYGLSIFIIIFLPQKLSKKNKKPEANLGLKRLPSFSDLALSPIALIVYLLLAVLLSGLFSLFPWYNANQAQDLGLNLYMNHSELILSFFTLAIIAPIAEEIIFRGWLYDKLRKTIPGKLSILISIILVSALFGLIHGQLNVAVNVFAMSVVACLLREITGSIYAGIFLHIIKNTIAFLLVYVYHIS